MGDFSLMRILSRFQWPLMLDEVGPILAGAAPPWHQWPPGGRPRVVLLVLDVNQSPGGGNTLGTVATWNTRHHQPQTLSAKLYF